MESFKEFLTETSLSRVMHHTKNTELGTISASRGGNTPAENNKNNKSMEKELRDLGHSVIHVRGSYKENIGTPQEKLVQEHSYIVLAKKGSPRGELLEHLKFLGNKYHQDAILHKHSDEPDAFVHGTKKGGKEPGYGEAINVGTFHPNKPNPFGETLLKGERLFSFGEGYENKFLLTDKDDAHFKFLEKWQSMNYTIGNNPNKSFSFRKDENVG